MLDILLYILLFAVLAAGAFFGYIFLQAHLKGGGGTGSFFAPKPEKRLDVVEQWSLDARRRLVLIRRDNVEHLIMTGGPVDVVIETGIGETSGKGATAAATTPSEPVFSRPARPLGTAAAGSTPVQTAPALNGSKTE
jgi:flagellar protein FliO/FliZ